MRKKSFLYGAILLTISGILTKIFGAIYRIPLTAFIGTEGIGLYQMIFPVYALLFVISSSGIPICVSRLISSEVAIKRTKNFKLILKTAIILTSIISIFCSLIIFFGAKYIAFLQGNIMATLGYFVISPAIFLGSLVAVFRGYFEGLQNMKPTAISEIFEQLAKLGFGLLFAKVFLPMGLEYGVMGAVLGITLGEIVSLFLMIAIYIFNRKRTIYNMAKDNNIVVLNAEDLTKKGFLKKMFIDSLPITFGASIVPLTLFFDSILMINLLTTVGFSTTTATRLFGIQAGVVASLLQLPIIISISLSTALLPNIVASKTIKNKEDISFKSMLSIKLVYYISLACFFGFFLLAPDITTLLYNEGLNNLLINETQIAINLIYIGASSILYHSLLRIFIALLHAMHKSKIVAKNLVITSIIKIVLTVILVLIPKINIYGAIVASSVGYSLACIFCFLSVKKYISLNFLKKEFLIIPLIASAFLIITILFTKYIFGMVFSNSIATSVTIIIAGVVYFIAIFLLKGFKRQELNAFLFFSKKKQEK